MKFLHAAAIALSLACVDAQGFGPRPPNRPSGVGNQAPPEFKNIDIIAAIHNLPGCIDEDHTCDAYALQVAQDVYVEQAQWPEEVDQQGDIYKGALSYVSAYLACSGFSAALGNAYYFLHARGTFTIQKRNQSTGANKIHLQTNMAAATLSVATAEAVKEAVAGSDSVLAEAWVSSDLDYCDEGTPWAPYLPWLCSYNEAHSISYGFAEAAAWGSAFSTAISGSEAAQGTEVYVDAWNIQEFTASVLGGIQSFSYSYAEAEVHTYVESFSMMESETFHEQCRAVCAKQFPDGTWDYKLFCDYAYAYAFANAYAYAEAYGSAAAEVLAKVRVEWGFEAKYTNNVGPGDSIVFGSGTGGKAGLAVHCNA